MARGSSGRIVLEVDPDLKNELYALLAREGVTLKDWFVDKAEKYIESNTLPVQLTLTGMGGKR